MTIMLKVGDLDEFDTTVTQIDAWYDRYTRNHIIQLKNKDGYQVGDAIFAGNKKDRDSLVKGLKEEYGI